MSGVYPSYIVVGSKPWDRNVFDERVCKYPGRLFFIGAPDLAIESVRPVSPRLFFFYRWSWKVPE